MTKQRVSKLILDDYGSFLGMEKGCFIVRDKDGNAERYPLFENEIGEVVLKSGNAISTGALASLGFWGIDVLVVTQRSRPVAMLKSFDDDSHVKTRLCQYEAYHNEKGVYIVKQLVKSRMRAHACSPHRSPAPARPLSPKHRKNTKKELNTRTHACTNWKKI